MSQRFYKVVILITMALLWLSPLQAATYTVTSKNCSGPDSIVAAIDQANLNPGTDTIEFANGLQVSQVNGITCGLGPAKNSDEFYLAKVTDDLVINGNNAAIEGDPYWVTYDGFPNLEGKCPSSLEQFQATVLREAPGFLRVEPGVTVEVNDLKVTDLSALFDIRDNAALTLNRVDVRRINDWVNFCDRPAILVAIGTADVSITDSFFYQIQNDEPRAVGGPDKIIYWGSAIVSGAGTLKVKNTKFQFGFGAIQWSGQADIESSRFTDSGWVNAFGSGTKINIVNSVFHGRPGWDDWARIRASGGAEINVSASSMSIVYSNCPPFCFTGDGALIAVTGGTINLKESALGIQQPAEPGEILRTAGGGSITADAYTWIQPVTSQSATALRTITGQPALLTDPPGLPDSVNGLFPSGVTPLLGTNVMPGVLIDAIADANPGEANELVSPINGTTITVDALGNPRVDGNGKRNIGGVQLSLAPHLNAVGTGNATVDLSWNRSLDPASGAISGYDLCYGSGTPPDPSLTTCVGGTMEVIASPGTLGTQVDSLTNGTTYWFQLRGVNVAGGGPWSNQVSGTPYGMIGTPTLAVTSTSCSAVLLEWTQPDMDGHTFAGYTVTWGLASSGIVTGTIFIPDYDTLSTTITDLDCNATYFFAVTASSVDGSVGGLGTSIVATPPLAIPALDQMGLLLLTMLMLGIGMVGVRRFI